MMLPVDPSLMMPCKRGSRPVVCRGAETLAESGFGGGATLACMGARDGAAVRAQWGFALAALAL